MKTRVLGATGLEVSPLGFGAAPVGYLGIEQRQVTDLLRRLLDRGINVIDTAACYPGSEELIGNAVATRRDEFVLVTKCGHTAPGLEGGRPWSADLIERSVDRSLRQLRTDRIDVLLLHSCDLDDLEDGEAIEALMAARASGKARYIGYSGDNEAAAYAVRLDAIDVLETSISICDQASVGGVLPTAHERNVGVIAKRPIANAAWKPLEEQPGMYEDYARVYAERFRIMGLTPEDLGFTGTPREIWPQVALRFVLSLPGVVTAIVGTTDLQHLDDNVAAVEQGPLEKEQIRKIREAFRRGQEASGETWIGQT